MPQFTVIATASSLDGKKCPSYGIEIISRGAVIRRLENITFSKDRIEYISCVCNKCRVSPVHFNDVLENYLSDFEGF